MQFTGHSLPVHQSMSVPWDFYLVPYFSQPAYAISSHNCHRNVSLSSGASLWNGMFGRVEGQYTTRLLFGRFSFFFFLFVLSFFLFFTFFFRSLSLGLVTCSRLDDPFVSRNLRELCASYFTRRMLGYAYTICSYGEIETSCIIPR